jgi:hypothetical protein
MRFESQKSTSVLPCELHGRGDACRRNLRGGISSFCPRLQNNTGNSVSIIACGDS